MAGLSLQCGDCGVLLRSVEEAQAHAEATSHSNFAESTEAVLNLVCSACGKPCRSQTEVDLHTKRTGHAEFADKTMDAAKPIDLETPPKPTAEAMDVDASPSGEEQEMVVPEVNKEMLADLEGMGFSTARATRALHFSGNSTIEGAINWLSEHQEDPDIDEMPLVPANTKTEANKPNLTPEEVRLKAQELRERARKKKEEEERRMEREREKERIRIGKELLEAKKMEEQNERKRMIELRRLEKEEEKRARDKIRQKLEEDKAERRRKLGLPPEDPTAAKPSAPPPVEEKKSGLGLPVRPATKAERMRDCLRNLKQQNKSYKMPEFRDSKSVPLAAGEDVGRGFFIRRVVSPSSLAVRGTARKNPARRFILPSNNKENMPSVWAVRATPPKRRSPLPKWYPRTPLRDITAIAKAIQRSRLRIAATQEQSRISEQSLQSVNLTTSAHAEQDVPPSTEASLNVASSSSSGLTEIEKIGGSATLLAEDDLKVLPSPAESSMKAPSKSTDSSIADTVEKKLSSSIEQIEKMVKKNMKRTASAAQRSKKIIQRRTLMSLR